MRAMSSPILSLLSADALARHTADGLWRDETIYDVAAGHARATPDGIALIDRWRRIGWRDLVALADAVAADFAGHGLAPGQRVLLWLPGRIETVAALLACSRAGLVGSPSPHRNHTVAEVMALATRTRAAAILYQPGFGADGATADLEAQLAELPSLRRVLNLPPAGPNAPFAGLLRDGPSRPPARDANAVSYLAFTSGSTGQPKGVMHSDNTLLVCPRAIAARLADRRGLGRLFAEPVQPQSRRRGRGSPPWSPEVRTCMHDRRAAKAWWTGWSKPARPTWSACRPMRWISSPSSTRAASTRCGRLTGFRVSGAAASPKVMEALLAHRITPQSGYGMTENNAHQYTLPDDDAALIAGTSGKACRGYDAARLRSDDRNVALAPGEMGQIGGQGA